MGAVHNIDILLFYNIYIGIVCSVSTVILNFTRTHRVEIILNSLYTFYSCPRTKGVAACYYGG